MRVYIVNYTSTKLLKIYKIMPEIPSGSKPGELENQPPTPQSPTKRGACNFQKGPKAYPL